MTPDSRWVISSSMDKTIRTWDVPSASCIDIFTVPTVPTSIAFSPTSEVLASTHADEVGIFLWSNRSLYENIAVRNATEARDVTLPKVLSGDPEEDVQEGEDPSPSEVAPMEVIYDTIELEEQMISLSELPRSKWNILLNLDEIRERNKPVAPPKKPEKAPFFLPTVSGLMPTFDTKNDDEEKKSRISKGLSSSDSTEFGGKLKKSFDEQNGISYYISINNLDDVFFEYCKSLSPSMLDMNIRSLRATEEMQELKQFLLVLEARLDRQKDYELVNAYLHVFLKVRFIMVDINSRVIPM
jgi:U3 small nucleolar RNA-associated protein 21